MNYRKSKLYCQDLQQAIGQTVGIENLRGQTIMITGATGLIGSFLVDMLMQYNLLENADVTVLAVGRSRVRLADRFGVPESDKLVFVEHDVTEYLSTDFHVDYLIHAASNAYPAAFNRDPVGTMMSNIQGTKNLLDYGKEHGCKRFLFVSSGEVYGQGSASLESYSEEYSGYVNPVEPRSCYPNSKRAAETLCAAHKKQFGTDVVVVRPCHTYGPNATQSDNRANVQFVNSVLSGETILLNSAGTQLRSYCYIADNASGILTVLLNGVSGEAYNIANVDSIATIRQFADCCASKANSHVEFVSPDAVALAERSPISRQVLNSAKLESLGWHGMYSVDTGVDHTIRILRELSV